MFNRRDNTLKKLEMGRISVYGRWKQKKRHSKWEDVKGTVCENLSLVIGRNRQLGFVPTAGCMQQSQSSLVRFLKNL